MKKPNPKAYGIENELWSNGGKEAYEKALKQWEEYRQKYGVKTPGRQRTREIHPSWVPYLELFDSSSFYRSQGAFCRASGVNRATLSGVMCRPITVAMAEKISMWAENYALQITDNETARSK